MRRREILVGLAGAAALGRPFVSLAQQPAPVIGFLSSRSPGESAIVVDAFRQGLAQMGFVEGRNVGIAFRWAEGNYERLPALAAELVRLNVTVIFAAGSTPSARAAKDATQSIPIVFSAAPDPVAFGLVASFNRPGGNVTGMATLTAELGAKSVEILKEMVPGAKVVAYLVNPLAASAETETGGALEAARHLGIQVHVLRASTEREIEEAFALLKALGADGLVVQGEPSFDSRRERIAALAEQHRVPAKFAWREYVVSGGLMSYGTSLTESYRRGGLYVGRILKGEKPGDLPVMQPEKFELVLNLKTAKTLGIEVPPRLIERADDVIE
ncbi:MAG TPA: ABC transporter substrate-binding protein [Beijerinckiaceae bacterium]